MELAGALALATAGVAAGASAGGAVASSQAIALGLSLARRTAPRTLPLCGAAFGLGFVVVTMGGGTPTVVPGTAAGPGPGWAPAAIGVGWVAIGVWTLLPLGPPAGESRTHGAGARGKGGAAPQAALAIAVALLAGALAGWLRPPHAGPVLALLSAAPAAPTTALEAHTSATRAALLYHAGAGLGLGLAMALAGAALQRMLAALRLGWIGPVLLLGWGALGALGGYGRAAEAVLRYWPLTGLG